jgi:hypothetical protein
LKVQPFPISSFTFVDPYGPDHLDDLDYSGLLDSLDDLGDLDLNMKGILEHLEAGVEGYLHSEYFEILVDQVPGLHMQEPQQPQSQY